MIPPYDENPNNPQDVQEKLVDSVMDISNQAINAALEGARLFYLAWLATYTARNVEPPPVMEAREIQEQFLLGVYDQMEKMAEHLPDLRNFWVDEESMNEVGNFYRRQTNEMYSNLVRAMSAKNN